MEFIITGLVVVLALAIRKPKPRPKPGPVGTTEVTPQAQWYTVQVDDKVVWVPLIEGASVDYVPRGAWYITDPNGSLNDPTTWLYKGW